MGWDAVECNPNGSCNWEALNRCVESSAMEFEGVGGRHGLVGGMGARKAELVVDGVVVVVDDGVVTDIVAVRDVVAAVDRVVGVGGAPYPEVLAVDVVVDVVNVGGVVAVVDGGVDGRYEGCWCPSEFSKGRLVD